ncbi:MAG: ATP-binding protein, partial [Myxococcales bacterium]|nr:ATP-binding protein [Myxococcales bacterium]
KWFQLLSEVGHVLEDLDGVPESTARLAVLQACEQKSRTLVEYLKNSDDPLAHRLRQLSETLLQIVRADANRLVATSCISVDLEPAVVEPGADVEVGFRIRNPSKVALRGGALFTSQSNVRFGYLAEGGTHLEPLRIQVPNVVGALPVDVHWRADLLDGTAKWGDIHLELLVRSTRDAVLARDLGPSPYIVGNPVDREEMFYGRRDVLERIKRQLGSATKANVILLEGNRRTGKTSILRQLQKQEALPGWVPVYCSFQDAEGDESRPGISTRNVYRLLARTLGWGLFDAGVRTWIPGETPPESRRPFKVEFRGALDRAFAGDHPFEVFEEYLSVALAEAKPRRVLLMLDEFDKLQEGIDTGVTSPQVPENIRHILQHHEGLSAILTGSRRLKRLREEYWSALFGLGYRLGISALPLEDAGKLVTEPVTERLDYLPAARDRVVELCARQPFLIQSLCNRVFEKAAESGERTITVAAVNDAAGEMVLDNEHFRTLWEYAQTHRRRLILALCERLANEPDAVNLELLYAKLEGHGVRVARESHLGDDLEYLRELELVEFDKAYRGGTYRVAVPLLGMWIRMSIDLDDAVARAREEAQEAHT